MKISEVADIDAFRELCESLTALTGMVTAILDLDGNIIFATGWQDICTRFHRTHPLTSGRCRESDTILAGTAGAGDRYTVYKCMNGLMDVAARITIGGEHIGNFFTGQFFLEAPDKNYFVRQAEECGFDKISYLDALSRVPIFNENYVRTMMSFFCRLAHLIGEMGFAKKRLEDVNIELKKHRDHLEEQVAERTEALRLANDLLQKEINEKNQAATEKERLIGDLQNALDHIKILSGLLPICASCKKIRDDKGYWSQIESYISKHSDVVFSHSICPDCMKKFYPDLVK